jgi:hypothetical protein
LQLILAITYWTNQATIRLLICELAIARYHNSYGRWPRSLSELVPQFLPAIPLDPLDPNGGPMKYRLEGKHKYLVYSVGPNRIDDGGTLPDKDELPGIPKSGDIWLEEYFRPDDEFSTQNATGSSASGNDDTSE